MGAVLRTVERGHGHRFPACSRYAIERVVDIRREDNGVTEPATPAAIRRRREYRGRAPGQIESLELLVGEKADGSAIRGPEWELASLGPWYGRCRRAVQRPQEQQLPGVYNSRKHEIRAVAREHGRAGAVAEGDDGYVWRGGERWESGRE